MQRLEAVEDEQAAPLAHVLMAGMTFNEVPFGESELSLVRRMHHGGDFVIEPRDYDRSLKVFIPTAIDKPIPYAKAVDMSFVKKAHAKFRS